jgi:hypothetical protein
MEAIFCSETFVDCPQTKPRYIPEDIQANRTRAVWILSCGFSCLSSRNEALTTESSCDVWFQNGCTSVMSGTVEVPAPKNGSAECFTFCRCSLCKRPWRVVGLWAIGAPTSSRQSAYNGGERPPFNAPKIPGTHFCWRLNRPQIRSAAGRIRSTKKCPMASRIEPAAFRLVAKFLVTELTINPGIIRKVSSEMCLYSKELHNLYSWKKLLKVMQKKTKLRVLSPRANCTDRLTAACQRNDCQLLRM